MTLRLRLLPARDGDCLLLSWGDAGRLSHMVIDGGRKSAYPFLRERLAELASVGEGLALYVLSHIDADHIEGALAFIEDPDRPLNPQQVWFNGYEEMRRIGALGERQGDRYSTSLARVGWPLNAGFKERSITLETAPEDLSVEGLKIRLLSPDRAHLDAMHDRWTDWRKLNESDGSRANALRRSPMPSPPIVEELLSEGEVDPELPNGSSIAFIAEWQDKRILLAADAHPDLLAASLAPLAAREGGRFAVDLVKLSHHGSRKNTTRELMELLDCRRYVISTNGAIHGHPDPETIARVLAYSPSGRKHLYFNYETDRTLPWAAEELMIKHDYECHWPAAEPGSITIDL